MKHIAHIMTLLLAGLSLSLLAGCLELKNCSKYFTPAENWMSQRMAVYYKQLSDKEIRGEELTAEEKRHKKFMDKQAIRYFGEYLKRKDAAERAKLNRQPKDPNSAANRPGLGSGTGVTSGGISFGAVAYFYSGGSWWSISKATPADIAKIKAGKVKVSTSGSKIGYVGAGVSSGPPRPMLK